MDVAIIHGWKSNPDKGWKSWLQKKLKNETKYGVFAPYMPNPIYPKKDEWVEKINSVVKDPKNTVLVGHSLGCIAILRYILEKDVNVKGVILVAGFYQCADYDDLKNFCEEPINWEKLKEKGRGFTLIFSDNDPYIPLEHGKSMAKLLDSKIIIKKGKYHFGSDAMPEFPEILEEIKKFE